MAPKPRRALFDRLLECGWLSIALLVPLAINPWGESVFSLPKAALLRTAVLAMLAVWLADWLLRARPGSRQTPATGRRASTRSPLALPAVALLAVIALSTALAEDPALSFWGSHGRAQGALTLVCLPVLMLLLASRLPGAAGARRLFWVSTLTVLPLAVYAGLQVLGPDPLGIVTDARSPVFATLGRSNFLGAYMAMLMPLSLTLLVLARRRGARRGARLLVTALAVLELLVLAATQARAAMIAAFVGVACWTALLNRRRLRSQAGSAVARVVGASLGAVAVAAGLWLAQAGGSGAARLAIWQGAQRLIVARPLLGYGPDSLGLVFSRVYPPELVYYQGRGLVVDRAHNLVLDWTLSLGTLGLFAGAALLLAILKSGWRTLATSDDNAAQELLVIGALSALVGNLAGNLVAFDIVPTLALSSLLAGVVVALEQPPGVTVFAGSLTVAGDRRLPRLIAAVLVAVATVGAVAFFNLRPLVADSHARQAAKLAGRGEQGAALGPAERSVSWFPAEPVYRQQVGWLHLQLARTGVPDALEHLALAERALEAAAALRPKDVLLTRALAEFHGVAALEFDRRHLSAADETWKKATTLGPNHGALYLDWGRLRLRAGDPGGATPLLEKAVDLDATDAEGWLLLAGLDLQRGDSASALVKFRQAAKHAPGRPEPVLGLARVYWLLGQPEAARTAVKAALELDPTNGDAVAMQQEFSDERQQSADRPE